MANNTKLDLDFDHHTTNLTKSYTCYKLIQKVPKLNNGTDICLQQLATLGIGSRSYVAEHICNKYFLIIW
jgi:hypothetical protein